METTTSKSFLESGIYKEPRQALEEAIKKLDGGSELVAYLQRVLESKNPKDDSHQQEVKPLLEELLDRGNKEEAGLAFNVHRILTEFAGYGANEKASGDVAACFGSDLEIPDNGLIVVDFFVTRNLPKIIEICEERKIDLGRIRVCAPQAVMAAQLVKLSDEKRKEFEAACAKLREDQFIIEDANHNADIAIDGEVAVWFSPRTMPITPYLHAENEQATIENYCDWFKDKVAGVVGKGRIYANLAYSENWQPLAVEETAGKRKLTKLTGISRSVAVAISKLLVDDLGFKQLGKTEFSPAEANPKIDHAKLATELHLVKE